MPEDQERMTVMGLVDLLDTAKKQAERLERATAPDEVRRVLGLVAPEAREAVSAAETEGGQVTVSVRQLHSMLGEAWINGYRYRDSGLPSVACTCHWISPGLSPSARVPHGDCPIHSTAP